MQFREDLARKDTRRALILLLYMRLCRDFCILKGNLYINLLSAQLQQLQKDAKFDLFEKYTFHFLISETPLPKSNNPTNISKLKSSARPLANYTEKSVLAIRVTGHCCAPLQCS